MMTKPQNISIFLLTFCNGAKVLLRAGCSSTGVMRKYIQNNTGSTVMNV